MKRPGARRRVGGGGGDGGGGGGGGGVAGARADATRRGGGGAACALAVATLLGCWEATEPARRPPSRDGPTDMRDGPTERREGRPEEPLGPLGPAGDPAAAAPALIVGGSGMSLDAVLLDPRAGVAWWGSATALEAWDLGTGKTFWRGTRPARPLDLVRPRGEVAVAERDGARTVLTLYRTDRAGARVDRGLVSDDLGVPAALFGAVGTSVQLWAAEEAGAVLVGWEVGYYWVGGTPPPPGPPAPPVRGGARVDLRIGRVARLDPAPAPPGDPSVDPALEKMLGDSYSRAGRWCCGAGPLRRHGKVTALWCEAGPAPELRRFEAASGVEIERRPLMGAPCYVSAFTRDGGHVAVLRDGDHHRIELWALDGRGLVGVTSTDTCRMDVWVLGDAVYCLGVRDAAPAGYASTLVRAFNLRNGKLRWERPLTAYDARPRA
ncbi:MAG TPA: hypothetical protein VG389_28295 [Myxococcota bacterium]|nr:hypothetical protein [Myxococcota bacterium]